VSDLQAGPEIDAEIARRVFGLDTEMRSCHRKNCCGNSYLYSYEAEWLGWVRTSQYSADIAAAWLVVEKMREMGIVFAILPHKDVHAIPGQQYSWLVQSHDPESQAFYGWRKDQPYAYATDHSAPLAICRAALAAVTRT
jgi:hypothetical protein